MESGRRLSIAESLFASGIAVVGATIVTHPIDVVKVQLQISSKSNAKADSFSLSRFLSFWREFQKNNGLRGLFSGVQAAGLRAATYGSVRIGLCEPLQTLAGDKTLGALSAGVAATVVGNPLEVLKVRLQAQPGAGEAQLLRRMVQEEGLRVFARGFGWAALRSALLTASQVVPYASVKSTLQSAGLPEGGVLHVLASLAAGVVSTTVTAPVDVMKTKVMSRQAGSPSVARMLEKQGPFVFFKGWLANYVRIGPQTLFIFVFFEQSRRLVESWSR